MANQIPTPLLQVVVDDVDLTPALTSLCAGYERKEWRSEQLAEHLFEWLPEFTLSYSERLAFQDTTAVRLLRRAAQVVYASDKYQRRGEFGELLLHAVIRQHFGSEPAISKLFYKDSANDTVKGFDAVHVVPVDDGSLELWLGEVKFYEDGRAAVRDVVAELQAHTTKDFLREEFALIVNKIDAGWPFADRLKRLLDPATSLDQVFDRLRVPVLLTYDSDTVARHTSWSDPYPDHLDAEVRVLHDYFVERGLPNDVTLHLLLVPLSQKKLLLSALHARLEAWRDI